MKKTILVLASLLIWLLVGSFTIFVTIPIILYTLFFWWLDTNRRFQHRLAIYWGWCITHMNPLWKLEIHGLEHFPKKGAFVLVSNHTSLADIIILFCLNRQFKWLAKDSLFKIPLFGWAMRATGYIPLERGRHGSIRDSFEEAHRWLKRGVSVLIFPEGTRSIEGHLGTFRNGAFKLALKSGIPIVPIVITGPDNIIQKGSWIISGRSKKQIHVLEPVPSEPYAPDHYDKLKNHIHILMAEQIKRGQIPS